jgi:transcriptional regulator with PAS, ATPase and Fis domain
MAAGEFRRDLYYRLLNHHVLIPPLRERKEDLPLLLEHFLEKAADQLGKKRPTVPKELPVLLATYDFPGNVRELEAMVHDAVSRHEGRIMSMKSFAERLGHPLPETIAPAENVDGNPFSVLGELPTLQQGSQLLVAEAMCRAEGNQSIAARLLGISQPALSKRLKK